MKLPLLINTPEPMLRVRLISTKDNSEEALKTLHEIGVLHVELSDELNPIERATIDEARDRVSKSLSYIDEIMSYAPEKEKVSLREDLREKYLRPFESIESDVRLLHAKFSDLYNKASDLREKTDRLKQEARYLRPLSQHVDLNLVDLSFSGKYLSSKVFILPTELKETFLHRIWDHILHQSAAVINDETVLYVIARADGQKDIESAVADLGCRTLDIVSENLTLEHFLAIADGEIQGLEEELAAVTCELQTETEKHLEEAVLLREVLLAESEKLAILDKAAEAKYVTVIEGWIPETDVESTVSKVKENIEYSFIDVRTADESEEPPTKLRNLKPLKPFEVVLALFGLPKYKEWDPTPLIAYSFAFFFGLMLGDVFYALGLMLAARFVLPFFVDNPESDGFRMFKRLIYISSFVGLIVGLMTGTYFGDFFTGGIFGTEGSTLALVGSVREMITDFDPVMFIVFSLILGLVHVNIGHLIGLIQGIKDRNKGTILNRTGLFIFEICAIPVVLSGLLGMEFLSDSMSSMLLYIIPVGIVMIVISTFMSMGGLGAIFWLFDITGILGDVMSYSRLAGVGLATFYLAQSFNMLASWISGELSSAIPGIIGVILGGLIAVIILVFAHLLNLALSGLASFIHSLRLCFVEFLFKFYEGGGRQYEPFCLKQRTFVVLG